MDWGVATWCVGWEKDDMIMAGVDVLGECEWRESSAHTCEWACIGWLLVVIELGVEGSVANSTAATTHPCRRGTSARREGGLRTKKVRAKQLSDILDERSRESVRKIRRVLTT